MAEVNVGSADAFDDPGRKIFEIGGMEVGVFRFGGQFYAWENRCPHVGGPACQGILVPRATEALNDDMSSRGREFSKTELNLVCPWHGFEFDIRTGRHPTKDSVRLRAVGLRVHNGDLYLNLPKA